MTMSERLVNVVITNSGGRGVAGSDRSIGGHWSSWSISGSWSWSISGYWSWSWSISGHWSCD